MTTRPDDDLICGWSTRRGDGPVGGPCRLPPLHDGPHDPAPRPAPDTALVGDMASLDAVIGAIEGSGSRTVTIEVGQLRRMYDFIRAALEANHDRT